MSTPAPALTLAATADTATPITVPLAELGPVLACGLHAPGRAGVIRAVFAELAADPAVQFVGIGPAETFDGLRPRLASHLTTDPRHPAQRLLAQTFDEMFRRQRAGGVGALDADTPRVVLLVDEAADILSDTAAANIAGTLTRLGAPLGVMGVWTTAAADVPAVTAATAVPVFLDHAPADPPGHCTLTLGTADPIPARRPVITAAAAAAIATETAHLARRIRGVRLG